MVTKDAYFDKIKQKHGKRARIPYQGDDKDYKTPKQPVLYRVGLPTQLIKSINFR